MNASKSKTAADQSDQQDAMGFYATGEGITRYVAETVRIDGNAIGNMNIGKAEIIDLVKLESAGKTYKHIAVASWKRSNQPYHFQVYMWYVEDNILPGALKKAVYGTDKKAPAFNVMQYMAIIDNYAQDSGHSYALHWCVEKVKENLFNAVLVWGLEKDTLQSDNFYPKLASGKMRKLEVVPGTAAYKFGTDQTGRPTDQFLNCRMEKQFQYLQQMMSKDGKLPQISTGGNVQPQMTKEKTAGGSQPASTTKTPSHTKSSVQKPKEEPKDATADSRSKTSTTSQGPEKSKEQESQGLLQKQKSEITKPSYKPESHEQILPPKQRGIGKDQADTTVSPHGKDVQQQQHQKIQQPGSSKEVRDAALDKPGPQTKTDSSQRTHSQQTTQPRETKPRESKADPLDKQDSHDKIKTQERHAEKKVEERGNEPSPRGYLTVDTGNKPTPPRQLSRGTPDKCQQTSTKPDDPFKSSKDQSQQAPEMGKIPGSKHGADFVSARDPKQPIFPDTSRSKLGLDSGISHKSPFVRAGLATLTDTPGYGVPSTVKKDVAPTSTPKSTLGGPGGKTAKGDALDELLGKSKSGSDKCSPVVAGQYPTHPSPSGMTIGQKTARSLLNPH